MNFDNLVNCDCLNGKKNGEKWDIGNCKQCSCEVRSHILFFCLYDSIYYVTQ